MYTLYGGRFTRALIVEMVLNEGDIPYELKTVDIINQEHRKPSYLSLNPAGLVPTLVTPEGQVLGETPAINLYLAERHGLTDIAPAVGDPDRGPFLSGLFFVTDEIEPAMKRYFYPHRYVLRPGDREGMRDLSMGQALELLGIIDRQLGEGGPYYLGERFSLIDLTLAFWTAFPRPADALDGFAGIRRCLDLVVKRPKIAAKLEELKHMNREYSEIQVKADGVR